MGVAERKERHKEELKSEILSAAHKLFTEKGYEAISIRNIAERIEYSPATIYLYFKDKNEIIHALHQEGFKSLVGYFQVLNEVSDPFERLKAMGRAYIRFALENQDVYELLFVMKEPLKHVESCMAEEWDEGGRAFDILLQTVLQCQERKLFIGHDAERLSFMIWSFMHGLCSLRISGHLGHVKATQTEEELNALMKNTYESFVQVLESIRS